MGEPAMRHDIEIIARRQCAHLLELAPGNDSIESLVLVAFTLGAAWALNIEPEAALAPKN